MRVWFKRHRALLGYLVLTVGMTVALATAVANQKDSVRAEHRDIARNCITGQRAWDTLNKVVHTAYETRSLDVDPKTLPPETQKLLAALAPLLKSSAGRGHTTEQHVLDQLGPRPSCS